MEQADSFNSSQYAIRNTQYEFIFCFGLTAVTFANASLLFLLRTPYSGLQILDVSLCSSLLFHIIPVQGEPANKFAG